MVIAHCSESLSPIDPGFVHAVGLAAHSGAAVRGIHVTQARSESAPPRAGALLERWGKPATAVEHEWLLSASSEDLADAVLDLLGPLQLEWLIVSTHARSGLARVFLGSVAEGIARNVAVPVLFLPQGGPVLVDAQTGATRVERVLVLAGSRADTEPAIAALSAFTKLAGEARCKVELLHVDDGSPAPEVTLPPELEARYYRAHGSLEHAAAERARAFEPDLVVMSTHGHDQLSDVVFSSHTERVLHELRRPLLWVPAPLLPTEKRT